MARSLHVCAGRTPKLLFKDRSQDVARQLRCGLRGQDDIAENDADSLRLMETVCASFQAWHAT